MGPWARAEGHLHRSVHRSFANSVQSIEAHRDQSVFCVRAPPRSRARTNESQGQQERPETVKLENSHSLDFFFLFVTEKSSFRTQDFNNPCNTPHNLLENAVSRTRTLSVQQGRDTSSRGHVPSVSRTGGNRPPVADVGSLRSVTTNIKVLAAGNWSVGSVCPTGHR